MSENGQKIEKVKKWPYLHWNVSVTTRFSLEHLLKMTHDPAYSYKLKDLTMVQAMDHHGSCSTPHSILRSKKHRFHYNQQLNKL